MNENSKRYMTQITNPILSHRIDVVCLAILVLLVLFQFIGFFSCLIRSDYNFTVIFFTYFIWQQRKDSLALKIILCSTIIVTIFDIIFAFTQLRVWTSDDPDNQVWQTIRPMHNFGIFCYTLIMILKIILIALIVKGISDLKKAVQVL